MALFKIWDSNNNQWVTVEAPMPSGFGTIKIGEVFIDADGPSDTLSMLEGDHVKLLPNESFDSVVISVDGIGDLASLPTLNKEDLVKAIIELNNKVDNKEYTHKQLSPSSSWLINHNLNKRPSVSITDSGGSVVIGDVYHIDENNLTIDFTAAFSGTAYLT